MLLALFQITPNDTAEIWSKAGEIITDMTPLLTIFVGVAVGLLVILAIIKIIKS